MLKISVNTGLNSIFNISNQNMNNTMNITGKNYSNFEDSIYNKIQSRFIIFNHACDNSYFNKIGNQTPSNDSYYNLIPDIHYKLKFKNIRTPNKNRLGNYSIYSYRINEKNNTFQ